jgi:Protein of unknown function (DUF998)
MEISAKGIGEYPLYLSRLLACGVIGPLFFITVFLIEGATRPDYSPLRHPVSSLSCGDWGWMQRINFVITGLLLFAFAIGLRRILRSSNGSVWGPRLIALAGIGLIGAGLFAADPLNGYSPGTPLIPTERTIHGILHDLFGVPMFLGLPIACFVFRRQFLRMGERIWAAYSTINGLAMLTAFVLTSIGFNQVPGFADFAGLLQRLTIILGLTWIMLLAIHFLRTPTPATIDQ